MQMNLNFLVFLWIRSKIKKKDRDTKVKKRRKKSKFLLKRNLLLQNKLEKTYMTR